MAIVATSASTNIGPPIYQLEKSVVLGMFASRSAVNMPTGNDGRNQACKMVFAIAVDERQERYEHECGQPWFAEDHVKHKHQEEESQGGLGTSALDGAVDRLCELPHWAQNGVACATSEPHVSQRRMSRN